MEKLRWLEKNALLNAKETQWRRKKKVVMMKRGIQRSTSLMSKRTKNPVQRESVAVTRMASSKCMTVKIQSLYAQKVVAKRRLMEKFRWLEKNALLNAKENQWRKKKVVMMKRAIQRSTSLMSKTTKKPVRRESVAVTRRASSKCMTVTLQSLTAQTVVAKRRLMEKLWWLEVNALQNAKENQ